MPGGITQELDSIASAGATTINTLVNPPEHSYKGISFWVEVTEITGGSTWRVSILKTFGAADMIIAQTSSITTTGVKGCPTVNTTPSGSPDPMTAVPHPSKVQYEKMSGTGNFSATVHVTYGD